MRMSDVAVFWLSNNTECGGDSVLVRSRLRSESGG